VSNHADLARAWAKRVRLEGRRSRDGETDLDRLLRERDAVKEARTLERFADVIDGTDDMPDEKTPPVGTEIPAAARQPTAGAPPEAPP
jgi:hypothetical protein